MTAPARKPILCFGEPILRLAAPGRELLLQSRRLDVDFGGAEMNVAVALARLGAPSRALSVLPDNPLGGGFRDELRKHGVDVSKLAFGPGRMALYFLVQGALARPSEVHYDRAGSAFALAGPEAVDWPAAIEGAGWLHLSGITPALGEGPARSALKGAELAKSRGVKISFDGNHRAKLWETAPPGTLDVLQRLVGLADLLFADQRDIGLVLGRDLTGAEDPFEAAAAAAFDAFPGLERIACTQRAQHNVDHHDLTARLATRSGRHAGRRYPLLHVVDRIGTGDAFSAGLLFALSGGRTDQDSLDFALATAVLKHSIPGDFCLAAEADVLALVSEGGFSVRR
jgi:2-dehydro-3-deoxygluconokinase